MGVTIQRIKKAAIYRKIGPECGIAGNRDEEADEETYTRGYLLDQSVAPSAEKGPCGNYNYKNVNHWFIEL